MENTKRQKKRKVKRRHEIAHRPFKRLVRDITFELRPEANVIRADARSMLALQDTTESYIMQVLEDSAKCAVHSKRITVQTGGQGCL